MKSEALKCSTTLAMVLFAIVSTQCTAEEEEETWRYFGIYGVNNWSYISDTCNANNHSRQSPINIVVKNTVYDQNLTQISLNIQKASDSDTLIMTNNGHTVSFNYNNSVARIVGGCLTGSFRVGAVHFHWGSNDSIGSEHTIDGQRYPMEMHVVTYDETRFSGVMNATGAYNSLAVLGVLFTLSPTNNTALDPIISHFNGVIHAGNSTTIPYFNISTLLPPDTTDYYRYLGSLTTPPCAESVIWTVFQSMQNISSAQLKSFRQLQELTEPDGQVDYIEDNWRQVEPLDGRIVTRSYQNLASTNAAAPQSALVITMMTMMIMAGTALLLLA